MADRDHWLALARWTPLAVLTDLDGTLIPFAATPDLARPGPEVVALLNDLAASPGVIAAVVSGRRRETLDTFFAACPDVLLVAEHGGWRRDAGAWHAAVDAEQAEVDGLADELRALAAGIAGALVERKTWSVAFHFRAIAPEEHDAALVEVETRVGAWLVRHPHFDQLRGEEILEVRPQLMDKGGAVGWLRDRAGARARLLALGDDVTDEDTFRRLGAEDESVLIGGQPGRPSAARWHLDAPSEAVAFLRWIVELRRGGAGGEGPVPRPFQHVAAASAGGPCRYRLLVVSNRLPELRSTADSPDPRRRNVGGLVSALIPVLRARQGIWLGWSGRTLQSDDATEATDFGLDDSTEPRLAWVDLPEVWRRDYYNGFCNGALWPLLHSFSGRVRMTEREWEAYRRANEAFASAAGRLVGVHETVWIHDYHLLLLGRYLREHGHRGPLGLFLHVPFPGPDIWYILPWAEELLVALLGLDLVGFHTPRYVANFRQCAGELTGTLVGDDAIEFRGRRTRIGAFPIGILPESFQEEPSPATVRETDGLVRSIAPCRLILGVDRLDYTKGIPERLAAFARLLELHPEWRRKVSLVQISVPSRGDVPEYGEQRERVERIVGRTNGEFGDADWVPIRYLYRSFGRNQLSALYRLAAVGYVTPLRDGMNLVAKEFVAAQDAADPGVLLLSRFAGAAHELADALLTNPWYVDGLAHDLDRALRLGLDERRARHARLAAAVSRSTALTWAESFLSALASAAGVAAADCE